ncbi:hypothetical protein H6F89_18385 [Cyanobacteria bacterium FACHB-63]|nr:hypothetical protein [Cyanobacteria bacterium FACHB-63]
MNQLEKICLTGLIALPLGVITIAFGLLKTPSSISCQAVEGFTTATRLYCAEQHAQRGTPERLSAAIDLLKTIPTDDPYHQQSDRLIQQWSSEILTKAETEVQAGNLERAIAIARLLAQDTKIQSWRSLWEKGEALTKTALDQMEKREWKQAFQTAQKLQQFENPYWATEQYDSLVKRIQSDRELRDSKLKDAIAPSSTAELEPSPPEPENAIRTARPIREVYSDSPTSRPVSAVQPSKPEIEPAIQSSPEPEPPIPQEQPPLETPAPEKNDPT